MAAAAAAATAVKPGTEALLGLSAYVDEDALSHAFPVKVVAVVELFMAPAFETNVAAVATGLLPVVCMFANRGFILQIYSCHLLVSTILTNDRI